MRKLSHEAEWLNQDHINQSTGREHTPFQFWHLCSFCHSARNPSVGIWKKWFFLPLKWMFCWLLEVVPSLSVFLFFCALSQSWQYFPLSFHSFPSETDIFLLLPLRSSWPKKSFTFLAVLTVHLKLASALAEARSPETQRPSDDFQGGQGATPEPQRGLSLQYTNLFPIAYAKVWQRQITPIYAHSEFKPGRNYYRHQTN